VLVNEATQECVQLDGAFGDECWYCWIRQGWKSIGHFYAGIECPEGYSSPGEEFDAYHCFGIRAMGCCSDGFSGYGDCEYLIVNEVEEQCSISLCSSLPEGWRHEKSYACGNMNGSSQRISHAKIPVRTCHAAIVSMLIARGHLNSRDASQLVSNGNGRHVCRHRGGSMGSFRHRMAHWAASFFAKNMSRSTETTRYAKPKQAAAIVQQHSCHQTSLIPADGQILVMTREVPIPIAKDALPAVVANGPDIVMR
jgi:hypothetical protein